MKNRLHGIITPRFCAILLLFTSVFFAQDKLRAPAYPLIIHNPNFSIWSMGDALNQSATKHWTGKDHPLIGIVAVDGNYYRFLGKQGKSYQTVLPAADEAPYEARYTEKKQPADWTAIKFDHSHWEQGHAPFGNQISLTNTEWVSSDLWYRRSFELQDRKFEKLYLKLSHDDNVTVYLNGEQIFHNKGWQRSYKYIPLSAETISTLKRKNNILAIHIRNTGGAQYLDAGLVTDAPADQKVNIKRAQQVAVELTVTQTRYSFKCGPLDLTAAFTSPLLMDDIEVFSRPVSYVSVKVASNDGKDHNVQLYFGASGNIAVNTPVQEVKATTFEIGGLAVAKVGTTEQPVLKTKGDDVRIDWGYFYVASPSEHTTQNITANAEATGIMDIMGDSTVPALNEVVGVNLMLNTVTELGPVNKEAKETVYLLGYDEVESISYFGAPLKPWFKNEGSTMEDALVGGHREYKDVIKKCTDFDQKLHRDAKKAGGEKYAQLCELAYRQSIGAHTLVKALNGDCLFLSKENNGNGSINTVDATYSSAPLFLIYNPELLKGMLNGIFYYSESKKWTKPFPAHDLGTYPIVTGQTYGGNMPIEEAGYMLILTTAIAQQEGNADFVKDHWETLTDWAQYLVKNGFDPKDQPATDDFADHLEHNANLSVKTILAIACYGKLATEIGDPVKGKKYMDTAKNMAEDWQKIAADGDHYDLAFGQKGTWGQKYNLVWDDILDLDVFPEEVHQKEIAFYLTEQNKYGLPLDSRENHTKSDCVLWTATLANDEEDFKALTDPIWQYVNDTPDRVPLSDWYWTKNAERRGFKARSVVGGYFIKLLKERKIGG